MLFYKRIETAFSLIMKFSSNKIMRLPEEVLNSKSCILFWRLLCHFYNNLYVASYVNYKNIMHVIL
jgi:hypothetical protein